MSLEISSIITSEPSRWTKGDQDAHHGDEDDLWERHGKVHWSLINVNLLILYFSKDFESVNTCR